MTAAFFKMSFSTLRRATSRRRERRSSAADLRSLRVLLPFVEQIAADAEFFGDLGDGLAGSDEFNGLGFELGGVTLTLLGIHPG